MYLQVAMLTGIQLFFSADSLMDSLLSASTMDGNT